MKRKIYWYYPHLMLWMGGTKYILEVLKLMGKSDRYETVLICNTSEGAIKSEFKRNKINLINFSFISTNNLLYWLFFPMIFIVELCVLLFITRDGDIYIATSFPCNLSFFILSKIRKKLFISHTYEPFIFFHNKEYMRSETLLKRTLLFILSFLYSYLDVLAVKGADVVLTLNKITKKMIFQTYGRESIPLYMGVDTDHFKINNKNIIRFRYRDKIIISHSTDYTKMKRTDLAIRVLQILLKKHPNIVLLITSTRPYALEKNTYVQLAKKMGVDKNIVFLGLVKYEELPLCYGASLCYLSCSYNEMLGSTSSNLPVKEAMACGTPVIRANVTTEDVEDGKSGFLVDPRDINLVAKKIEYLIQNRAIAKKMGAEGRKKIISLYNWDKVAKTILKNIDD